MTCWYSPFLGNVAVSTFLPAKSLIMSHGGFATDTSGTDDTETELVDIYYMHGDEEAEEAESVYVDGTDTAPYSVDAHAEDRHISAAEDVAIDIIDGEGSATYRRHKRSRISTSSPPVATFVASPIPQVPDHTYTSSNITREARGACRDICAGAYEVLRRAFAAVVSCINMPFHATDAHQPQTRRFALAVIFESWVLVGQLMIVLVCGWTGPFADHVHVRYLLLQSASLLSVPLGIYISVMDGVTPNTANGVEVISLYIALEILKAFADFINLFRFAFSFDDARHIAQVIAPELVHDNDDWDHGIDGQPHMVSIFTIVSCAFGVVLSMACIISAMWMKTVYYQIRSKKQDCAYDDDGTDRDGELYSSPPTHGRSRAHRRHP